MAPSPFQITFFKRSSCSEQNFQVKIYKKRKEKNVSKRFLTVMAFPSFKLPFSRVQDEVSAEIYKK